MSLVHCICTKDAYPTAHVAAGIRQWESGTADKSGTKIKEIYPLNELDREQQAQQ